MPVNQMYHTWFQWLGQLWPQAHVPRWRNAAWFMTALQDSHSVQLQRIAGKIPGSAKLLSRVRRLERFLASPRLRVAAQLRAGGPGPDRTSGRQPR